MKRGIIPVMFMSVFFLLIAINTLSALNLELSKTQYYPSETMQVEIPDVFLANLQQSNIGIYKGDGIHKTPAESGLIKSQGKYYFYAIVPELTGDYILKIENIAYQDNSIQSEEPIIKNFSIVPANSSYLSFNPGQVLTSNDFSIVITAYNAAQPVSVEFLATGFKQSFNLGLGSTKKVYFSISGINTFTLSSIKINSYTLPVIITPVVQPINDTNFFASNVSISDLIEVIPSEINITILEKINYDFKIALVNKVGQLLSDVTIVPSAPEIKVSLNKTDISSGRKEINLTINSDKNIIGKLNISYKNSSIILPINIKVTQNKSNVVSNIPPTNLQKTCKDLQGIICNVSMGEQCTGVESDSLTGVCCLAECKAKSSSSTWIWGIVLLIFLAIGGWLLYKKSQEKPGEERSSELIKRQAESYKERISPQIEVKKSLVKE